MSGFEPTVFRLKTNGRRAISHSSYNGNCLLFITRIWIITFIYQSFLKEKRIPHYIHQSLFFIIISQNSGLLLGCPVFDSSIKTKILFFRGIHAPPPQLSQDFFEDSQNSGLLLDALCLLVVLKQIFYSLEE